MAKSIILSTRNKAEAKQICTFLAKQAYAVKITRSLKELGENIGKHGRITALLDLDSLSVDNHSIHHLAVKYPKTGFLCMSEKRLHPDLKDAICNCFYACLTKPLNYDELMYWLKCVDDQGKRI